MQPPQNVQVPNYSGVNIQIFNPSVGAPGAAPVYNVNSPNYGPASTYPAGYYTNQWGGGQMNSANNVGNVNNTTTTTTTTTETQKEEEKKKTEKRKIVELTDEYIKNLENYLNSNDAEVRIMGAKEVVARLQEDDTRKDDLALNALVNKMLQDPNSQVRILALSMLDTRCATGDNLTVQLLQQMQNSAGGYGQDAVQAANILLKMSGKLIEKEFEVQDKPKKEENKS
jgi:hypothetical protein